jgi:hypothetical protein
MFVFTTIGQVYDLGSLNTLFISNHLYYQPNILH